MIIRTWFTIVLSSLKLRKNIVTLLPAFNARHLSHCGRPLRPHFLSLGGFKSVLRFSDENMALLGQDREGISLRKLPTGGSTLDLDRQDIGGNMAVNSFCIGFRRSILSVGGGLRCFR